MTRYQLERSTGTVRARGALGVVAVLVIAAALVAAGCGGGSDESPQEQWAADVCGALADWKSSLTSAVSDFTDDPSKDTLTQGVDDVEAATSDLVDQLTSIGAPETDAGDQAKQEIDAFADTASSSIDAITAEAESLADSGLSGLVTGVSKIASEIEDIVQAGETALSNVEQLDPEGELKAAIENDETCQNLTGGS